MYNIPPVITIVIQMDTRMLDNKFACFAENFIDLILKIGYLKNKVAYCIII